VTEPDAGMSRVGAGIALSQAGDLAAARRLFADLWAEVGPGGDAFHRCAVAHWMADVQDDPALVVEWDLRALAAAESITPDRAVRGGMTTPVAAMYPSLHLNIADAYLRLHDNERARRHLEQGLAAANSLPDDGYGRMIRGGLERLEQRLAAADP
jgi:hypothetical protein